MRTSLLPLLLLSPLALASGSGSHSQRAHKRSHRRVLAQPEEVRQVEELVERNSTLAKRQSFTGRGTFYYTDVGLGACGQWHGNNEWTVALNSAQYGGGYPGPNCFKTITIQANGQTRSGVSIMDECPTCDWGGLDLSPGLFTQFADESAGVIQITWWFDGSAPSQPSTTTTQAPTTTWSPPSSTWSPPASSSTWTTSTTSSTWTTSTTTTPPPSSSSTTTSVSSTSSYNATTNPFAVVNSVNSTSTATSSGSSASATATGGSSGDGTANTVPIVIQSNGNNLEALNGLVTNYGQIIVVGAGGYKA